jgi:hypothetical protein
MGSARRGLFIGLIFTGTLIGVAGACGFPDYGFLPEGGSGGTGTSTSASTTTSVTSSVSSSSSDASSSSTGGGCTSDADCTMTGLPVCDIPNMTCVPCLPTDDKCGSGFYCDATNTCVVGCKGDADCDPLKCDVAQHKCFGCQMDDDCPAGSLCNVGTSLCEAGCTPTHDCMTNYSCCTGQCFDTANDKDHCGDCTTVCNVMNGTGKCTNSKCLVDTCDPPLQDCNGLFPDGCESDSTSDPLHCGNCMTPCTVPNASVACQSSSCVITGCNANFGDCNAMAPGCETDLTLPANCGGCGVTCLSVHTTSNNCVTQLCDPKCDPNFKSCDGNPNNGCETSTQTLTNCGDCDVKCDFTNASETCPNGACTFQMCDIGWGNCDGNLGNGCETDTTTSNAHCGMCNHACTGGTLCANGNCVSSCPNGTADCNMMFADGCEVDTTTDSTHCGNCPTACGITQSCMSSSCMACGAGGLDCDRSGTNGCEINGASDPNNCGGCGTKCGSDGTCGCSSSSCSGGTIYFSEDFSDNSRGWTLDPEWQIGAAQVSSGHQQGNPDPGVDHTSSSDNGVAGVTIGGNYIVNPIHSTSYYLTSPVINLASATTPQLTYWRWLNCDYDPFTVHTVEVFNGTSWVVIWTNSTMGNTFVTDNSWTRITNDVTAYKNANFRVRFGFKTGKQGQFLAWIMSGWNVDDVTISSGTCQ